jgi:hypothetical protein
MSRRGLFAWLSVLIVSLVIIVALRAVDLRDDQRMHDSLRRQGVPDAPSAVSSSPEPTTRERLTIGASRHALIRNSLPRFDSEEELEVPFSRFQLAETTLRLLIKPAALSSSLELPGGKRLSFPRRGVPLKIVGSSIDTITVFFRDFFSNIIYIYTLSDGQLDETLLSFESDARPIFRDAVHFNGHVFVLLFDNERGANDLFRLWPNGKVDRAFELPSLDDPAGRTYEMIPRLRFVTLGPELWIVGGTLLARLQADHFAAPEFQRLPGCVRAQDVAVKDAELMILCVTRAEGEGQPYTTAGFVVSRDVPSFKLFRWTAASGLVALPLPESKHLPVLSKSGDLQQAATISELRRVLISDLEDNHSSGVMELGINNIEGRVAWSQIYFLNGLMDILSLVLADDVGADLFASIAPAVKLRLDLEMYILDRMVAEIGFETKGFTVGRKPALFAVQTSRLLLLYNRYTRVVPNGVQLVMMSDITRRVLSLEGHIETVAIAQDGSQEPSPGRHFLIWPKGSAFYFDGLNVPYNHQNEWAHSVIDTAASGAPTGNAIRQSNDIIEQFITAVAPAGTLPSNGVWPYWWGAARAGWTEDSALSVNRPSYPGDRLVAWISFRSIDASAVLASEQALESARRAQLEASVAALVSRGLLYPFVAGYFKGAPVPVLLRPVALSYARMTAPSDLPNAAWALHALARTESGGDARKIDP